MTDFMTMKASKVEQASFMWSKVNSQASTGALSWQNMGI